MFKRIVLMQTKKILLLATVMTITTACNGGGDGTNSSSTMTVQATNSNNLAANQSDAVFSNLNDQAITKVYQESSTATMYAATANNGLFISTDRGYSWIQKNTATGLPSNSVVDVIADDKNIYLIVESIQNNIPRGLALVSRDNGTSWNTLLDNSKDCPQCSYTSIAVQNNQVYLGSDKTVYSESQAKYTSIGAYLSISPDSGQSFQTITLDSSKVTSVYSLAVVESNIYFLDKESRYNGFINMGVIGLTVTNNKANIFANHSFWNNPQGLPSDILYDLSANKNYLVIGTTAGVSISSDKAKTFTAKGGLASYTVYGVAIDAANKIFAATDNGYSISKNIGSNWENYFATSINQLSSPIVTSIFPGVTQVMVGTISGLSLYNNDINHFDFAAAGNTTQLVTDTANNESNSYAATYGQGLIMFNDKTHSVVTKTYDGTTASINSNHVNSFFAEGKNLYAGTIAGLSISFDNGATWIYKDSHNGLPLSLVTAVFADKEHIYAGTYGKGVAISDDGGTTWSSKNHSNGIYGSKDIIYCIFEENDNLYLGTYQGLSFSTDGGNSWQHALDDIKIYKLFVNDKNIYAAVSGGIYISSDGGKSWAKKTNNLDGRTVSSLTVAAGIIYVGLDNGSLAVSADNGEHFNINTIANNQAAVSGLQQKNGIFSAGTESGIFTLQTTAKIQS